MRTNLTLLSLTFLAAAAQAQNSCSTALPITPGTYTVEAVNGPEIPAPICAPNGVGALRTEWYSYTPDADYSLTVSTDLPQNAGRDTRFHIYEGACGALDCVGGADDAGSNTLAAATVQVSGGITYRIAFDDRWSALGFDFTLSVGPPVVTQISFSPVNITVSGSTYGAVDMTGDHLDDVVSVTATNVNINRQTATGFSIQNIATPQADFPASWSMAVGDIDGNGWNDLQYGAGSGVTFMLATDDGTGFAEQSFTEYVFSQRGNFIDINNDGDLDAFMCHDVDANVFFMNDGTGTLSFNQGGLGETCGNYGSIWVDYDGDHDQDLFVAKCGCDPVDILYRNNGDGTFTNVASPLGFADNHQSWSSAWGDFDNDGDMDVLVGSSSSPVHKLMRNNGNGTFTNITAGSGFDVLTGTSIEWTTHDFNNDGYLDILGGGAMMLSNGDLTWTALPGAPGNGPIGDLNNDGFLDIVAGNIIRMNSGNTNKWLKVVPIGVVSNLNGIGARIEVTSALGTQMREIRSGDGFRYMSSLNAHFGLGSDTQIGQVRVIWPSGIIDIVENPSVNTTLEVVEGTFNVGMSTREEAALEIFPNPATQVLYVRGATGPVPVTVTDLSGKQALATVLRNGQIDVGGLCPGIYLLRADLPTGPVTRRFVRE
jgi:hypothetical protein